MSNGRNSNGGSNEHFNHVVSTEVIVSYLLSGWHRTPVGRWLDAPENCHPLSSQWLSRHCFSPQWAHPIFVEKWSAHPCTCMSGLWTFGSINGALFRGKRKESDPMYPQGCDLRPPHFFPTMMKEREPCVRFYKVWAPCCFLEVYRPKLHFPRLRMGTFPFVGFLDDRIFPEVWEPQSYKMLVFL